MNKKSESKYGIDQQLGIFRNRVTWQGISPRDRIHPKIPGFLSHPHWTFLPNLSLDLNLRCKFPYERVTFRTVRCSIRRRSGAEG